MESSFPPSQPHPHSGSRSVEWSKRVAEDFLAASISGNNAEAEMLLTEELKKRYERYPQCGALATRLLDVKYAGRTAGRITSERIAPDEDEARFTGMLRGERNGNPIESEFSLRVVRESGKWRVSYFHQEWRWVSNGIQGDK